MAFGTPKITSIEKVLDTNPDLYLKRAEEALRVGDFSSALMECDQAIQHSNGNSHYYFEKAKIFNHLGMFSDCIELISRQIDHFRQEMDLDKLGEVYLYLYESMGNKKHNPHLSYFVASGRYHDSLTEQGFGIYFYDDETVYIGQWNKYKRNGIGTLFTGATETYQGKWENDKPYSLFRIVFRRTTKGLIWAALLYLIVFNFSDMKAWVTDQASAFFEDDYNEYEPSFGASEYSEYLTLNTEGANIREYPDLHASVVTQVSASERLLYLEESGYDSDGRLWFRVRTEAGYEGWISSKIIEGYSSELEDETMVTEQVESVEEYVYYDEEPTENLRVAEADWWDYEANQMDEASYNGYSDYEKMEYQDGIIYEGETLNGQPHGQGLLTWSTGSYYNGQFEFGDIHGYGTMIYDGGSVYEGDFYYGVMQGQGTIQWPDGIYYHGEFHNDEIEGYGQMVWPDGSMYVGEFQYGQKHGYGTFTFPDGSYYEGEYYDDERVE